MWILIMIAVACLILGVLFLIRSKSLKKLEDSLNATVSKPDPEFKRHPLLLGIFLIVFAIVLLYIAKSIMR